MPIARSPLQPLAAALLLAVGDAAASGLILVDAAGDTHVDGRCTLRQAATFEDLAISGGHGDMGRRRHYAARTTPSGASTT